MEEQMHDPIQPQPETDTEPMYSYRRPWWHKVLAWIALAAILVGLALYYYHLAKGF